jgi:hypothetical protein
MKAEILQFPTKKTERPAIMAIDYTAKVVDIYVYREFRIQAEPKAWDTMITDKMKRKNDPMWLLVVKKAREYAREGADK